MANKAIFLLQETHSEKSDEDSYHYIWGTKDFILNHGETNSRGTAILFSNIGYKQTFYFSDNIGRLQILSIKMTENDKKLLIVNIYNPNNENPQVELLKLLFEKLDEIPNMLEHEIIIGGDWNCFIDRNLDCNGGNPGTKTKTLAEISKIRNKYDIFRAKHPDLIRYTWRCPTPLLSRRLDFFLISNTLQDCVRMINIRSSFMSDHSPVQLTLEPVNPLPRGAGIWKFNATFLKDEAFVSKANELFEKIELKILIYYLNNYLS